MEYSKSKIPKLSPDRIWHLHLGHAVGLGAIRKNEIREITETGI